MSFLDKLQVHKGGLIRLKTELLWYGKRGWDNNPGRICLILDAVSAETFRERVMYVDAATHAPHRQSSGVVSAGDKAAVHLLIDGSPKWIWAIEDVIDLLVNDPPAN
jgi:hypothetical protein